MCNLLHVVTFLSFLIVAFSWHGYKSPVPVSGNSTLQKLCLNEYKNSEVPVIINEKHPYSLWPNLVRDQDLRDGKVLFGFHEAIEIIWRHQHPPDCTKAKFMISRGWNMGFGSMVHVEMAGLALAMELGYVYLQSTQTRRLWQVQQSRFCGSRNQSTMECFYEPWSSCTLIDAFPKTARRYAYENMETISSISTGILDDKFAMDANGSLLKPKSFDEGVRVVVLHHTGHVAVSRFIPSVMRPLLACSPVVKEHWYYWWRAVTTAYYLRPNKQTIEYMATFRTLDLKPTEGCVGMYVRHGDKGSEMQLVPFSKYVSTADLMYADGLIPRPSHGRKIPIFLGTEDPIVIEEAQFLDSSSTIWRVEYTKLLSRFGGTAKLDFKTKKRLRGTEPTHHDLEYISMLLNLDYFLRCDAWVCTLASNWCRIMDELRATVGGKANKPFADLSVESCRNPPCYNGSSSGGVLRDFGWRM